MSDGDVTETLDAGAPEARSAPNFSAGYRFSRRIFTLADQEGDAAASIRSLRAHLLASHVRNGRRSLAICAPDPHSDATMVATNLAVAIAQSGVNTLLIDANLHDPGVDRYIAPNVASGGLRKMLTGDVADGVDEIRRDVLPNLSVLYAGERSRGASELMSNRRFKGVIDDCMRDFEFTIVNAPVDRGYADTRRVAMTVRYALIVAGRDRSYVSRVRDLATLLIGDRVRVVGTFLTGY